MTEILAKGPNFVFAREYIIEQYGGMVWAAVLDKLPKEVAAVWQEAEIDESYPFAIFKQGVNALAEVMDSPEILEMAEMYTYIADRSLNTVYKTFFKLASPLFVIKNYPRLWDRFFNTGLVEVSEGSRYEAVVTFTLPEIFLDWLPPACLGYSRKAVEMAGGKHFAMRPLGKEEQYNKDWKISYKLSWQ